LRIIPVRVGEGSIVHKAIEEAVKANELRGGFITGIGGLREAVVGFYNPEANTYVQERLEASGEVLEVASLQGNYLVKSSGEVSIHIHAVLGSRDRTIAGHLVNGVVKPILEVFLVEVGDEVRKTFMHRDK